jgi:hypothetical protein
MSFVAQPSPEIELVQKNPSYAASQKKGGPEVLSFGSAR